MLDSMRKGQRWLTLIFVILIGGVARVDDIREARRAVVQVQKDEVQLRYDRGSGQRNPQ